MNGCQPPATAPALSISFYTNLAANSGLVLYHIAKKVYYFFPGMF